MEFQSALTRSAQSPGSDILFQVKGMHQDSNFCRIDGCMSQTETSRNTNAGYLFVLRSTSTSCFASRLHLRRPVFQKYAILCLRCPDLRLTFMAELRVHFEPTLWREYANPGKEHPMSQVIFDVKDVYKKIGSKTLVMPASLVTCKEVSVCS